MRARLLSALIILAGAVSQSLASSYGYKSNLRPRQDGNVSVDLGYEIHTATANVNTIPLYTPVDYAQLISLTVDRKLLHLQQRALCRAAYR